MIGQMAMNPDGSVCHSLFLGSQALVLLGARRQKMSET